MTNKKPRTALAKLLDNLKQTEEEAWPTAVMDPQAVSDEPAYAQREERGDDLPAPTRLELIYVDPEKCRPWRFADRPEEEMGDLMQLSESIKQNGQQEPVLLRRLQGHVSLDYEVIFGCRRWRACQQAKVKLLAIVKEVTDQQAALCQKEENDQRKDLSDLARARSYKIQLDLGLFASETELSKGLNLSRKTLNDIMAFVRVPKELADAIPHFRQLSRAMAVKLAVLCKEKSHIHKLIKLGPRIGTQINTANIEKALHGHEPPKSKPATTRVLDAQGHVIFQIMEHAQGGLTIKINKNLTGRHSIEELKGLLHDYLTDHNTIGKPHETHHR